jgi:hypothetical protein
MKCIEEHGLTMSVYDRHERVSTARTGLKEREYVIAI